MQVLKSKLIFKLLIIGVCLVLITAALWPKSIKQQGKVAGTTTGDPLLVSNKFCDDPSSPAQALCPNFITNVLAAASTYQNISGDVAISGNVGIGTISPLRKLHVNAGTDINLQIGSMGSESTITTANDANTINIPLQIWSSELNLMGGNVGIGTASPGAKLDVVGNVAISGSVVLSSQYNKIQWPGASATGYIQNDDGYNNRLYIYQPNIIRLTNDAWQTGGGDNGLFVTGNNVGIGTASPSKTLHVNGDVRVGLTTRTTNSPGWGNAVLFSGGPYSGDNTDPFSIARYDYGSDASALRINLQDDNNDTFEVGAWGKCCGLPDITAFSVRSDGTGTLNASAWIYNSDRRMKENIAPISSGLDKIMQLNPIRFDYINGVKNNLGFTAQDVQPVIPEAVSVTDTKTGMLGLKTDFIIPYLVKGMQEQQKQVASLLNIIDIVNKIGHFVQIETQKLIVNGVDILEKLNTLSQKVDAQQREIDSLKQEIEQLKAK